MGSKQSDLLQKKGFGLVVSKVKANLQGGDSSKNSDSLNKISDISTPTTKISSTSSNLPPTNSMSNPLEESRNIKETFPRKLVNDANNDANNSGTNSLSMLFSQYDDSSG